MHRTLTAVALLTLAIAPRATADCEGEDLPGTLYALGQDGRMSVNGVTTKTYASEFSVDVDVDDDWWFVIGPGGGFYGDDPIDVDVDNPEDLWSSLATAGSDRYALQRSGRMKTNDKNDFDLPRPNDTFWLDMMADGADRYAIRSDGALAIEKNVVIDRNTEGFAFRRVIVDDGTIYCLRSDGNVYRDTETAPLFTFRAGPGRLDALDGRSTVTAWSALAVDPDGTFLYALRTDGHVWRGRLDGSSEDGTEVVALPFDEDVVVDFGERYQDLVFLPDGEWLALQADGRVYSGNAGLAPVVDLPGDASQTTRIHVDLDVVGDSWLSLRSDGRVYVDGAQEESVDLPGETYGSIALSSLPPTLPDDGSTKTPKAVELKVKSVVGTPLRIPVTVSDPDSCPDDLIVTPKELPPGAAWDAETTSFVWNAPGPKGKYKFKFDVGDGNSTRAVKWKINVKDPDDDPDKNKAPLVTKYSSAQAVTGFEFLLPIVVDDKDGDDLDVFVDETEFPFTDGATFDPETRTFRWTPRTEDQGDTTVKFKVNDGREQKTIKVKIKVKLSLL